MFSLKQRPEGVGPAGSVQVPDDMWHLWGTYGSGHPSTPSAQLREHPPHQKGPNQKAGGREA